MQDENCFSSDTRLINVVLVGSNEKRTYLCQTFNRSSMYTGYGLVKCSTLIPIMKIIILFFYVTCLFIEQFYGQEINGCVGPYQPPVISYYRYQADPLEVEVKVTSEYPVKFNWNVRKYFEKEWPFFGVLYYYIPEDGDDQFDLSEERDGDSTIVRLESNQPMTDAPKMVQLQMIVINPCNPIEYIANVVTLGRLADGSAGPFPVFTGLPSPAYVVRPGMNLSVPMKTERANVKENIRTNYGIARHLRRDGDKLTVEQRLDNITRYRANERSGNVTYTKSLKTNDGIERFSVLMNFKPWSESDSGVYVASLRSSYNFPTTAPYSYHINTWIRIYFDIRSRMVVAPALTVYSSASGEPRQFESNGVYMIPLSMESKWAQSVRCIAHASTTPEVRTTVSPKDLTQPWPVFDNTSTIMETKTLRAVAFGLENATYHQYTCTARAEGSEASLTFWTAWFTPIRLVRRTPGGCYINSNKPFTIQCTGRGGPRIRPFVKFYFLKNMFTDYPRRLEYLKEHKADELTASTNAVEITVTRTSNRGGSNTVTGRLVVRDVSILQGKEAVQCIVGDIYTIDYYRYWLDDTGLISR